MKYMALVYHEESVLSSLPVDEHAEIARECMAWVDELERSGKHVYSAGLQSSRSAATISQQTGHLTVTDGPFAETKEVLGGFTIFEAADLNDAIRIASGLAASKLGKVEVRPVFDPGEEMPDPIDRKTAQAIRQALGMPI